MKQRSLAQPKFHVATGKNPARNFGTASACGAGARAIYAPTLLIISLLLLALGGCTSEPSKPAEPAKPEVKMAELLTGRAAFQRVYVAARGWARDAQPY